jgi:hypothetical protein
MLETTSYLHFYIWEKSAQVRWRTYSWVFNSGVHYRDTYFQVSKKTSDVSNKCLLDAHVIEQKAHIEHSLYRSEVKFPIEHWPIIRWWRKTNKRKKSSSASLRHIHTHYFVEWYPLENSTGKKKVKSLITISSSENRCIFCFLNTWCSIIYLILMCYWYESQSVEYSGEKYSYVFTSKQYSTNYMSTNKHSNEEEGTCQCDDGFSNRLIGKIGCLSKKY